MRNFIDHCESAYSFSNEEKGAYGTAWKVINSTSSTKKRRKRDSLWVVQGSSDIFEGSLAPKMKRTRRSAESPYQQMATGRSSAFRRRNAKKTTVDGKPIYYVRPEALLPDGTVLSCYDRWEHFTASELRGFPFVGRLVTYDGGGYVANLGYNEETSWTVLADLHSHNWLDKQTRAVFVELTVYNANIDLFATAFLFIEALPTGGAFPWADFKVFNGYNYSLDSNLSARLVELIFIIFIVYFAVRELKKLMKLKLRYLYSFFNLIEIVLLPLYVMMFSLIIIRWLSTAKNIKSFKENPKDFVSFQYSAAADSALQAVIGVVSFLLNIKLLKLLQFAKQFYVVGLIFKQFAYPVLMFMIPFTLYFLLFAWVGHLGFGTQSEHFQSIIRTCVTQFLHLLGATDFHHIRESNPLFGPMYFLAYTIYMMFIVFNVFLAIICEAIDGDYDEEFEKNSADIEMADYLMRTFKDFLGLDYDFQYWNKLTVEEEREKRCKDMDEKMKILEARVEKLSDMFHQFETISTNNTLPENHEILDDMEGRTESFVDLPVTEKHEK